jgi:anti-sigma factor RsiW
MRHIPEEELHAYLDQALSRSQCVEIESHLAACAGCSAARDGIAALRDRTTALLGTLAPPRRFPPAFDEIRKRHEQATTIRRQRGRSVAWVASIAGALAIGYGASALARPQAAPVPIGTRAAAAPVQAAAPARSEAEQPGTVPSTVAASDRPAPAAGGRGESPAPIAPAESMQAVVAVRPAAPPAEPPAVELSSLGLPASNTEMELRGMWRTVSWDNAQSENGEAPARIGGLPVMQVQVQQSGGGGKPMLVVAQQLASGEVIRTIEGPVADVSALLSRRGSAVSSFGSPDPAFSPDSGGPMMTMRRGDRMLAITAPLPTDSLRAMIRRLNAERR